MSDAFTTRASANTWTCSAPARFSARAQACTVAPVVTTSSTRRMRRPATFAASGTAKARCTLRRRALAEGMAVARRLFKPEQYRKVDYDSIPTAVFSLPNIGTVGLTTEDAIAAGHRIKRFESRFRPMKLTLTDMQEKTLMKLVVDADTDRVLGCHMVGPDAGEIVQGLAVALKAGATKQVFDETIGIHPTAAEEFVTMRVPEPDPQPQPDAGQPGLGQ